ncbi:hypothetical protein ANN_20923 [Periplaneta americana]|uniref:Uncharacterized protein n=1 Tax=Periplaneta americana TaxID=6978 RepID=A0ABQ8SEL8_PERAM|nr:hypothetical protein ANN_20923 [Periplaneta americana]
MNKGDNAREMSPGSSTESYPAFARIGLRENTGKNLNQITSPDRDLNPGHLVLRPDALTATPQENTPWLTCGQQQKVELAEEKSVTRVQRRVLRTWIRRSEDEDPLPGQPETYVSSSLLSKNLKVRIYKTVILPVVLYGCETWTLTLREEQRFRVSENKVLRKIFGAKRDEVTAEWRKLHNAELHALYSSPDIIRNMKSRRLRWAGHVARMDESRSLFLSLQIFLIFHPNPHLPLISGLLDIFLSLLDLNFLSLLDINFLSLLDINFLLLLDINFLSLLDINFLLLLDIIFLTFGSHLALTSGSHLALTSGSHLALTSGSHLALTSGSHLPPTYESHLPLTSGSHLALTSGSHLVLTSRSHLALTSGSHLPLSSGSPHLPPTHESPHLPLTFGSSHLPLTSRSDLDRISACRM